MPKTRSSESTLNQMRIISDISLSRLLVQPRLHTRVECSVVNSSFLMSIQWLLQRYFSEPKSIIQISISLEESASISWRTNGHQPFKSELSYFPSNLWWQLQTLMTHLIKELQTTGNQMKMVQSRKPRNGLWPMPTTERTTVNGHNSEWYLWTSFQGFPRFCYLWELTSRWLIDEKLLVPKFNLTKIISTAKDLVVFSFQPFKYFE